MSSSSDEEPRSARVRRQAAPLAEPVVEPVILAKAKPLSRLEKELIDYNSSPTPEKESGLQASIDMDGIWQTRRTTRIISKLARNRRLSPRKSLNVIKLQNKVQQKVETKGKGKSKVAQSQSGRIPTEDDVDDEESEESELESSEQTSSDEAHGDRSYDTHKRQGRSPILSKVSVPRGNGKIMSTREEGPTKDWDAWFERQKRISTILGASGQSLPDVLNPGTSKIKASAYHPSAEIPDDFNLSMENGTFVFSPTKSVLEDFPRFLEVVENVAGREQGVVKVVIPFQCLQSPQDSLNTSNQELGHAFHVPLDTDNNLRGGLPLSTSLETCKIRLRIREDPHSHAYVAYNIQMSILDGLDETPASVCRDVVEHHRINVVSGWNLGVDEADNAWKEASFENTYSEETMIEDCTDPEKRNFQAVSFEAVNELRNAFRCDDPKLMDYPGNVLFKSRSRINGVHSPIFHASGSAGVPTGMGMIDFAAYSLNYLHVGAAKRFTVVKPKQRGRLEECMHRVLYAQDGFVNISNEDRPRHPPQCDHSLRHKSLYLPQETLEMLGVDFTHVVQHQNELLIFFPFAYHQSYSTGPNISESMAYASDRWEIFIKEDLCRPCHQDCPGETTEMDVRFASFSRSALRTSTRTCNRNVEVGPSPGMSLGRRLRSGRASGSTPLSTDNTKNPSTPPRKRGHDFSGSRTLRSSARKSSWEGDDGEWESDVDDIGKDTVDNTRATKHRKISGTAPKLGRRDGL